VKTSEEGLTLLKRKTEEAVGQASLWDNGIKNTRGNKRGLNIRQEVVIRGVWWGGSIGNMRGKQRILAGRTSE